MAKRKGRSAAWMAKIRKLRGKSKRKVYKVHSVRNVMPKRKRSKAVKRYRRHSRRGFGGSTQNELMGVGGYLLYKMLVSPRIPIAEQTKQIGELGLGYYFSKKGGILGSTGKAMFIITAFQLAQVYIAPHLGGMSSTGAVNYY